MLTVIAADDHPVVLSGIRLALRGSGDFRLLAEASNAAELLAAIETQIPELLILDLWMGENDGMGLLRQIHQRWPSVRVLVYSMNDEQGYGPRALSAGAAGYLMKSHGLDELVHGLRVIAAGERYLSATLAAALIGRGLQPAGHPGKPKSLANLTDRELQILRLIGMGSATGAIADTLNISPKTVGAHRENLKNKLNAENSAALVQQAIRLVEARIL